MTYPWLKQQGIYQQLVDSYVKHGWLKKLATGLFTRSSDNPTWASFIAVMQQQLKLSVHVGGRSAIDLKGRGHYVRFNYTLDLFGCTQTKLPRWSKTVFKESTQLRYYRTNIFSKAPTLGIVDLEVKGQWIKVSSLERAILEMLSFVPQHYTYEESAHIMENLALIRPQLVQQLLEACQSIKAKRLFLHLASLCKHAWLEELDLNKITLGQGVRIIDKGKTYDRAYQLYVPESPLNEGYQNE